MCLKPGALSKQIRSITDRRTGLAIAGRLLPVSQQPRPGQRAAIDAEGWTGAGLALAVRSHGNAGTGPEAARMTALSQRRSVCMIDLVLPGFPLGGIVPAMETVFQRMRPTFGWLRGIFRVWAATRGPALCEETCDSGCDAPDIAAGLGQTRTIRAGLPRSIFRNPPRCGESCGDRNRIALHRCRCSAASIRPPRFRPRAGDAGHRRADRTCIARPDH